MPNPTETQYELTFILDERAGTAEGRSKTDELTTYLESQGGSVLKEEQWGRRELAYPIKRNRSGFYATLIFTFDGDKLPALEQHLQFDEAVIRSLVTKAYTTAQPGSLYPQAEEETPAKSGRGSDDTASAEEMLRRSSGSRSKRSSDLEDEADTLPEEERLKQLDETLDVLLKEEV